VDDSAHGPAREDHDADLDIGIMRDLGERRSPRHEARRGSAGWTCCTLFICPY